MRAPPRVPALRCAPGGTLARNQDGGPKRRTRPPSGQLPQRWTMGHGTVGCGLPHPFGACLLLPSLIDS